MRYILCAIHRHICFLIFTVHRQAFDNSPHIRIQHTVSPTLSCLSFSFRLVDKNSLFLRPKSMVVFAVMYLAYPSNVQLFLSLILFFKFILSRLIQRSFYCTESANNVFTYV